MFRSIPLAWCRYVEQMFESTLQRYYHCYSDRPATYRQRAKLDQLYVGSHDMIKVLGFPTRLPAIVRDVQPIHHLSRAYFTDSSIPITVCVRVHVCVCVCV